MLAALTSSEEHNMAALSAAQQLENAQREIHELREAMDNLRATLTPRYSLLYNLSLVKVSMQ